MVDLVLQGGLVAALIIGIWAFVCGKILPASVVQKQLDSITELAKISLTQDFEVKVQAAVKAGFIEAWYELQMREGDEPLKRPTVLKRGGD
jgi:thiamine transporter ThiT